MIAFDLQCDAGHKFEGWFDSAEDFERQKAQALIDCPFCGSKKIEKLFSPFTIKNGARTEKSAGGTEGPTPEQVIRSFYEHLSKEYEDVGGDFAKEALKIHYGVSEKKKIRGVSTETEEKTLKDEGVEFLKVPMPRYDA